MIGQATPDLVRFIGALVDNNLESYSKQSLTDRVQVVVSFVLGSTMRARQVKPDFAPAPVLKK